MNYGNSWSGNAAHLTTQLQYHGKKFFSELAYTLEANLIGVRTLYHLPQHRMLRMALGGELYFSLNDKGGGGFLPFNFSFHRK